MNNNERINLEKMINENDVEDCTSEIRLKKHSKKIRDDVTKMIDIKTSNSKLSTSEIDVLCGKSANFLQNNYTNIFNKVLKNEINLQILWKMLDAMEKIEKGVTDQHNASFEVGKLLKEMYIDSALKRSERLDKEYDKTTSYEGKNITWSTYKSQKNM
tara:strand:- start:30079 stop:30552 length:474 start_codon:yes stop_codon:yes gene_type:complete